MNRKLWEAVRSVPGNAEAWFALGVAAVEASHLDEAKYALMHAVELAPRDVDRALSAGWQLATAGCPAEATRVFRGVLARHPQRLDVRVGLAQVLLMSGEARAALEEMTIALREEPRQPALRLLAADAHDRLDEPARAMEQLQAILGEDVDHPEANRRLAGLLARAGDRPGAIRCWRRLVVGANGEEREARTMLGIELSRDGQHDEALAILQDVAARDQASGAARANLGMALLAAERAEEAVDAFLAALELEPHSAQAACGLGLGYQRLGHFREAAQAFRATEELAPDSPHGPLNLALVLDELGEREEARLALLRAAELAPEDQEIRNALAQFLARPTRSSPNGDRLRPAQFEASITGDLESFQLFDVLEFLRLQSKTGALVLSSRQGTGVIRLIAGAVTSASAPGVVRLGQALLERGLLSAQQLEDALGVQQESRMGQDSPEALGAVLLASKVIDRGQLGKVVFQQILDALETVIHWSDGAFAFHADSHPGAAPPISFSVQQVILELMRQNDERNEAARVAGG
jgi:Flp pilus assembly protein TadD